MSEPLGTEVPEAGERRVRLGNNYWRLWTASVISNLGDGISLIAYPWLASAVTRNAILIALIAVAQRLPWLLFSLPAGVITDRVDRRRIMVTMQAFRTLLTVIVAIVVVGYSSSLPSPEEVASGIAVDTNLVVYAVLIVSALLFGMAEVLYDNSAQTILPAMVEPDRLERANGNLWGAEMVANSFVGPPLGSLLIAASFALPFVFDAGTFAVAAVVLLFITGDYGVKRDPADLGEKVDWWGEIKEGVLWLWRHPLLRPMAIILGLQNMLLMLGFSTIVLFAQEILDVSALVFALIMAAAAVGGILGSLLAPRISKAMGSGPSLAMTLLTGSVTALVIGLASIWPVVWVMFAAGSFVGVVWNVITVSLRQTIIPDRLLGRVNAVYRFFAWGLIPVGALLGGIVVNVTETAGGSRELALRMPWLVVAVVYLLVFFYAVPKLTTEKIEAARSAGIAGKEPSGGDDVDDVAAGASEAIAETGIAGIPPPEELDEPEA